MSPIDIDMNFSGLEKLKYLNLRGNEFKFVPKNVFSSLKNLKVLDLSDNMIKKLNIVLVFYIFNNILSFI